MSTKAIELPEKDFENFKKAERLFAKKQYKQAVKSCDLVLKKFEAHGETLALKGAILGYLAESDEDKLEAVDICKRGVGLSIGSKAGWILLARLYRQMLRYEESIKSFKNAINLKVIQWVTAQDRSNWRREMAPLLAQTRQWAELADVRRQIQLEGANDGPTQFAGHCMALYFDGQHELALASFREFRKEINPTANATLSDLNLIEARMIEAAGDKTGALDLYSHMIDVDKPDLLTQLENKARILLDLGRFTEAQDAYVHLVRDRNQENYDYHRGLQLALSCAPAGTFSKSGLSLPLNSDSPSDITKRALDVYATLHQEFPKSFAVERVPLDFCPADEFEPRASKFILRLWKKRVPCLFTMVKPLLVARPEVAARALRNIVDARLKQLSSADEDKEERGQVLCFLAQLLDKVERGSAASVQAIDDALATGDDPAVKNADFLRVKARLLKHQGNFAAAFDSLEVARQQELSDRFLNNKCAKYALRKDQPELALALTHLFTRGEDVNSLPDPAVLHDLQCMWFELESAESAYRTGNVVLAIKNFAWVQQHIAQVREDEHDFHDYALRKMILTSYADMVRMEDTLYAAPAFVKSVKGAVRCWLDVFDRNAGLDALKKHDKEQQQQKRQQEASSDEAQFAGMTPNEKKMAMKKIKAEKAEKERLDAVRKLEESQKLLAGAAASASASVAGAGGADEEEGDEAAAAAKPAAQELGAGMNQKPTTKRRSDMPVDQDPTGFKRFAKLSKEPLKPALELLAQAFKTASNSRDVELLLLAFDVNVRAGKLNEAWEYLRSASEVVGKSTAGVLARAIKLNHVLSKPAMALPAFWSRGGVLAKAPAVAVVVTPLSKPDEVQAQLAQLLEGVKPLELLKSGAGVDVVLAVGEAVLELGGEHADAATARLGQIVAPYEACVKAQAVLARLAKPAAAAHREAAKKAWPTARAFA